MHHHHFGDGRYIMRMDPGEDVIGCLRQFASEQEIVAGWITGLGAVSSLTLGFLDPETGEYIKRKFDETMEVGTLSGTISVEAEDGKPFIHLHGVFGPRELLAYTGHVHEARVGAVIELIITTYPDRLERRKVADKPFPWLVLPGEAVGGGDTNAG